MHSGPEQTRTPSLRVQVALVIGVLSFLPNLVMMFTVFLPRAGLLREASAELGWTLAVWVLVTAVLSAAAGYGLSCQLLSPLTGLTRHINSLRHLPEPLERSAVDDAPEPAEVAELRTAFDDLLTQVGTEQARRRAFMATLMHDLKTPLIASNHLLTAIRDDDTLGRRERARFVNGMLEENARLVELVQKFVDANKLERRDIPLQLERVELNPLVQRVVTRVKPLSEARGVSVTVQGEAVAQADARELERALYNLLSNAVRYARRRITVQLFPGLVRLTDDGPGLPAPLNKLAQPFNAQPVSLGGEHYTAGTGGLGLFIARRVLEAHGGRLNVESSGPQGTVLLAYLGREG